MENVYKGQGRNETVGPSTGEIDGSLRIPFVGQNCKLVIVIMYYENVTFQVVSVHKCFKR